jgi:acyl carrier protein
MEAFPLTSSGKIDRRALAARHPEWVAHETQYVAPRTPIEVQLAGIWAEVLDIRPDNGRPPVGTRDNFFELGGHSLLATQLIFRVYQVFQVELPLRSLFEAATIVEFAEVIERAKASGAAPVSPEIAPLDRNRHRVRVS